MVPEKGAGEDLLIVGCRCSGKAGVLAASKGWTKSESVSPRGLGLLKSAKLLSGPLTVFTIYFFKKSLNKFCRFDLRMK